MHSLPSLVILKVRSNRKRTAGVRRRIALPAVDSVLSRNASSRLKNVLTTTTATVAGVVDCSGHQSVVIYYKDRGGHLLYYKSAVDIILIIYYIIL